jgi:membrane protease subunit HflK
MAWNEPGGNRNNQDPWRGGGNDQGPPDLDEILRGLQKKLSSLFGGSRGGGGNSNDDSSGGSLMLFVVVLVIAATIWAVNGFYRVEQAERAVVLRFGKYHAEKTAGLHWNPPLIDEVLKLDAELVGAHTHQASMLTEDQNIVNVQLEVQYRVADARMFYLDISDAFAALRLATESALRHVVGGSVMESMITEDRNVFSADVQERLQNYLDDYNTGLKISKVIMRDASPPDPVKDAFDDVLRAKAEQETLKNEAERYRESVLPEANGVAMRIRAEAAAYKSEVEEKAVGDTMRFTRLLEEYQQAPDITRERLYIDAMQEVLTNSSKILMDTKGGQNLTYLPLDKILSATNYQQETRPALGSGPTVISPSLSDGNRDISVSRGRSRTSSRTEGR